MAQACLTGGGGCAPTSKGPEVACACCGTTCCSQNIASQARISVKLGTNFTTKPVVKFVPRLTLRFFVFAGTRTMPAARDSGECRWNSLWSRHGGTDAATTCALALQQFKEAERVLDTRRAACLRSLFHRLVEIHLSNLPTHCPQKSKNIAVWTKTVSIFDASVEHVRAHFNEVCLCIRAHTCRCDTQYMCVCVAQER